MTTSLFLARRSGLHAIRRMMSADVPTAVEIHLKSFPGFFLTFLGAAFLRDLYMATLADPYGIGFVSEIDRAINGFVMGTAQPAGFYRRLLRQRWWRFALTAIRPAIRKPKSIPRLLRAFSRPERAMRKGGRGTLMSVTVVPNSQGKGISKRSSYNEGGDAWELVKRSGGGICIPPESPYLTTEAIYRANKSPEMLKELGVNGRKYVEESHSPQSAVEAFNQMIKALMGNGYFKYLRDSKDTV